MPGYTGRVVSYTASYESLQLLNEISDHIFNRSQITCLKADFSGK